VVNTGHPSNLLRHSARNVRFRENLPFNIHLLDDVFAATPVIRNDSHQPTAKAERSGAFVGRLDVIVSQ